MSTSVRDAIREAAAQLAAKEGDARARRQYEDYRTPESTKAANREHKATADAFHEARTILADAMIDVLDNWTGQPATEAEELRAEVEKLRGDSQTLSAMSWRIAVALGDVEPGQVLLADRVPLRDLDLLVTELDRLRALTAKESDHV